MVSTCTSRVILANMWCGLARIDPDLIPDQLAAETQERGCTSESQWTGQRLRWGHLEANELCRFLFTLWEQKFPEE